MKSPAILVFLSLSAIVLSYYLGFSIGKAQPPDHVSCPFEAGKCPVTGSLLKDYQIDLHMDTTWLYDGQRLVGVTIDSTYAGKGLFDLITKDNE